MKWVDAPQGTPAWFEARLGLPTASEFAAVVDVGKNGQPLKKRTDYLHKLVAERITGPQPDVTTAAMARGITQEPEAVAWYAERTGNQAAACGFALHDSGLYGASPDATVGDDGLVECKTSAPHVYIVDLLSGGVPERFRVQIAGQLLVTGRAWCDFVQYCAPLGQLRILRVNANPQEMAALDVMLRAFCSEVDAMESRVLDLMSEWDVHGNDGAGMVAGGTVGF